MRNHVGAIVGMLAGLAVAFVVAMIPGCVKTDSVLHPGQKVTAAQLQREAVQAQQDLNNEATQIQQAISAHRASDTKAVADYQAKTSSLSAEFQLGSDDLNKQDERMQSLANVLGGLATAAVKGTFDPSSLVGSALSMLAVGGAVGAASDSIKKSSVISALRMVQISPGSGGVTSPLLPSPANDTTPATFAGGVPYVVAGNISPQQTTAKAA